MIVSTFSRWAHSARCLKPWLVGRMASASAPWERMAQSCFAKGERPNLRSSGSLSVFIHSCRFSSG